jgi:hypothetical protein
MPFLENIFTITDICMTVHGTTRYLKSGTSIREISDRTVSSVDFRITLAYMRYAFSDRHVGKLVSQVFHSLSRQCNDENRKNIRISKK